MKMTHKSILIFCWTLGLSLNVTAKYRGEKDPGRWKKYTNVADKYADFNPLEFKDLTSLDTSELSNLETENDYEDHFAPSFGYGLVKYSNLASPNWPQDQVAKRDFSSFLDKIQEYLNQGNDLDSIVYKIETDGNQNQLETYLSPSKKEDRFREMIIQALYDDIRSKKRGMKKRNFHEYGHQRNPACSDPNIGLSRFMLLCSSEV